MKAELLHKTRVIIADNAFAEIIVWAVNVSPSTHNYKYRLAYIVDGECVVRFDNERGKGDHYHWGDEEVVYHFTTLSALFDDFWALTERWGN